MATEPSVAPARRSIGKSRSGLTRAGGRRRLNLRILIGGGILTGFVVIAALAPLIAPYDPLLPDQTRSLAPPSAAHPLGHDEFGRDVLSRLIFGARVSIAVSMVSIALALGVGTLAGLLAGYFGGLVDWIVMRGADVVLSVPPVLLAIGAPLIVQGSLALGAAMLLESGLSFIGLGAQPPTPSWGSMVSSARSIMERVPLLVLSPSIALAAAILSFNILGDGVRDALDPRMR